MMKCSSHMELSDDTLKVRVISGLMRNRLMRRVMVSGILTILCCIKRNTHDKRRLILETNQSEKRGAFACKSQDDAEYRTTQSTVYTPIRPSLLNIHPPGTITGEVAFAPGDLPIDGTTHTQYWVRHGTMHNTYRHRRRAWRKNNDTRKKDDGSHT